MHATSAAPPWDFSQALDLIKSLSHQTIDRSKAASANEEKTCSNQNGKDDAKKALNQNNVEEKDFAASREGLGDFSKIYQYLGTPLNSPAPAVKPHGEEEGEKKDIIKFTSKDDYASDGATYKKKKYTGQKNVQFDDSVSAEETGTGDASDTSVMPDSPTLTKSQRKKRNRRERKAKEAAEAARAATVSESEADILPLKKAPALKASAHVRESTPSQNRYDLRQRDQFANTSTNHTSRMNDLQALAANAARRVDAAKKANAAESDATPSKPPKPHAHFARTTSDPPAPIQNGTSQTKNTYDGGNKTTWPVAPSQKNQATHFLPATVQPPSKAAAQSSTQPGNGTFQQNSAPAKQPRVIEPKVIRSGDDRHWALFMKLLSDFWTDRTHLVNPMNLTTHNNDPKGIHVFVDASNIFIGFKDQLKRSRGIPQWMNVPAVDLSFDALALLMERRRPVAKRVLAGSTPWLTAFDKAKAVGYECSILEKVYKARELTDRQIFFREQEQQMGRGRAKAPPANNVATVNGGANGSGSGSETNAPQYAPPAMIEQGVDEILHMKMLESMVDTEQPATMVLATGDAAKAEYSGGFMEMVERALKKGWTVELVSWSKNISASYSRKTWTDAWGEKFKIIFLDDYAEELLAM